MPAHVYGAEKTGPTKAAPALSAGARGAASPKISGQSRAKAPSPVLLLCAVQGVNNRPRLSHLSHVWVKLDLVLFLPHLVRPFG